jgi:hypothetical protein
MSTVNLYPNPHPSLVALSNRAGDLWTLGACVPVAAGAGLVVLTKIAVRSLLHPESISPRVTPALNAAE